MRPKVCATWESHGCGQRFQTLESSESYKNADLGATSVVLIHQVWVGKGVSIILTSFPYDFDTGGLSNTALEK